MKVEAVKKIVFDTDDILNSLENIKHDSPETYCFLYEGMKAVIEELKAKRGEVYSLETHNKNLEAYLEAIAKVLEMEYKKTDFYSLAEAVKEMKKKIENLSEPPKKSNTGKYIDDIGHLLEIQDFDTFCWHDKIKSIKAYIKQLKFIGRM